MSLRRAIAFVLLVVLTGPTVLAQDADDEVGTVDLSTDLRSLEPGVEDVGPLGRSMRVMEEGLQHPTGFDRVYRIPGSSLYVRVDGSVYAVFERSQYQDGSAVIPNDTKFFIGEPSTLRLRHAFGASAFEPEEETSFPGRIDTRLDPDRPRLSTAASTGLETPRRARTYLAPRRVRDEGAASDEVSVVNDASYRAARIRLLLRRAAEVRG